MDWNQLLGEATRYLQEYIRIETVNPPGNEIEAARLLKKIFDRESIPSQIYEPSPGRGSLLATLKGNGMKRPVLLLSHIDVVPAEKDKWEVDPFSGVIKDGYLYGRGTLDDKSMGIVAMMALLILKREKVPLKRDILFLAAADEETGGKWGVEWAVNNIRSLRDCEYAINEGGHVMVDEKGGADRYEVSSGQKVLFQLKLKARGTSVLGDPFPYSSHGARVLPKNGF
jgi:acetylornithine deacetylase/succinyl-diaminopimelate desuccinylase-like protein